MDRELLVLIVTERVEGGIVSVVPKESRNLSKVPVSDDPRQRSCIDESQV